MNVQKERQVGIRYGLDMVFTISALPNTDVNTDTNTEYGYRYVRKNTSIFGKIGYQNRSDLREMIMDSKWISLHHPSS